MRWFGGRNHGPTEHPAYGRRSTDARRPQPPPAAGPDSSGSSGSSGHPEPQVDRQELVLHGTQLVHWEIDGDELVIDLWGGTGMWTGYAGDDLVATGHVTNPPAFTVRAHLDGVVDLDLLGRLDHLATVAQLLTVHLDAAGSAVLERPVRIELSDGVRSLAVGMSTLA